MHIEYDITYHPEWWHQEAGIDFSQPFFDEPQVRIEADMKMRRILFDKFGSFGLGLEESRTQAPARHQPARCGLPPFRGTRLQNRICSEQTLQ